MVDTTQRAAASALACFVVGWAGMAFAQGPFESGLDDEQAAEQEGEAPGEGDVGDDQSDEGEGESGTQGGEPEGEARDALPAEEVAPEPSAAPEADAASSSATLDAGAEGEASAAFSLGGGAESSLSGDTAGTAAGPASDVDVTPAAAAETRAPVVAGSHIRREENVSEGALVLDGPFSVDVQGREYLQLRRQHGGSAFPDTVAAQRMFWPGTSLPLELRQLPTLVMLNGRRLVSAPYPGRRGADYVDLNQLPIPLIERVELTKGQTSALYGDGALGGAVNFITRRNFQGVEIDLGGQATDKFDQHETDIAATLGVGSDEGGVTVMASYFNRQPLAASDRDWIGERQDRVETLLSSPSTFQALTTFEFPFEDPACDIAEAAGHATGSEVRLFGYYGPPDTLELLPQEERERLLMDHDSALGNGNGIIEAGETSTYCAGDFTPSQDLVLKDERMQTYSTFWHRLTDHTEAYGELGYYRTENENRTAPSFPILRISVDPQDVVPVWAPAEHADQPVASRGFAAAEVGMGRVPNSQFIVGRVAGVYAGHNLNTRRVDVIRGVVGLKGDLEEAGDGSVLETWDWDVGGTYSSSESISTVKDTLLDKLAEALNSCPATRSVGGREVPTTIKERQQMGCFNPFYSSVVNNSALDPLGVAASSADAENGYITTDSDEPNQDGFGLQDGGYICDPNDPDSPPCPSEFDRNGDGVFELAGTPNTKQVMDRITGEQITYERRTLATVDGVLRGDAFHFGGGGLSFALGAQYRRETLETDYDAAYNQKLYAYLFGGPDVPPVARDIGAGFYELRLRALDGLLEVQQATRLEHHSGVGLGISPLGGLAIRPLAAASKPPAALEWLILRGHVGYGQKAPSLQQQHGTLNEFHSVEYFGSTQFIPHQISGNDDLDFEKYLSASGGLQWDFAGAHLSGDYFWTKVEDVIAADNTQSLVYDCEQQFRNDSVFCTEGVQLAGTTSLDHVRSSFDNMAEVETTGIDGVAMYTLDSKRRGLGDWGALTLGIRGRYIDTYWIRSPRALREYYRYTTDTTKGIHPVSLDDGTRDYSHLQAEYNAAGYRNAENFAPPMPRLRYSVPLNWAFAGHRLGVTMRYIGGYNDDSEYTIERYGLENINDLAIAEGESIDPWVVFDAGYSFAFGEEGWKTKLALGVINLLDEAPPEVEGPLGYEVGIHDPRGRIVYARVTGEF